MRHLFIPILISLFFLISASNVKAVTTTKAVLIKTTMANLWNPPAPDTSGITYIPALNQLLVADSEVEEVAIWAGANMFYAALDGTLQKTGNTTIWKVDRSLEPTGLSYDRETGLLYVSDDDQRRINVVNTGADGIFGTTDDNVTFFSTSGFGNADSESVAVSPANLFIGNGMYHSFIKTTKSGTKIAEYDTAAYNLMDIEGIAYNYDTGTVFVLSANPRLIGEFTTDGQIIRLIDITAANSKAPADLVFAPSSSQNDNPNSKSMYMVARGVDNNSVPSENDGRIYEMSIDSSGSTPIPTNRRKTGDVNGDGVINIIDIGIVIDNYAKSPIPNPNADVNRDGVINIIDIGIVIDNYGL